MFSVNFISTYNKYQVNKNCVIDFKCNLLSVTFLVFVRIPKLMNNYNVSIVTAIPMPPPTHKDATPRFLPFLNKACTNVTNILAPKTN